MYGLLESERLKLALRLLNTTNDLEILVSKKCGYNYPANFVAAFKRHFKTTPAQYNRLGKQPAAKQARMLQLTKGDIQKCRKWQR
ncbi:AraC family transcriptional regulator [Paraflavitalea speifideaquila]|uniref:helix-turn-helix domain-containing protein n=1 Tax=Paraflavitalea speifideaquila TaxID=3076558 RepID=UPI003312FFE0